MWLVPDWLSFAGVSVPAFLLVETNIVSTNRKQAEADASCLRYARVLTELARPVWKNKNSTLSYFLTFKTIGKQRWQLTLLVQNAGPLAEWSENDTVHDKPWSSHIGNFN